MLKISIVIPAYNVEKYIEKCIFSCINQNIKKEEYEIIIINDGSTDSTFSKILLCKEKYQNINVVNQQNEGLSSARNVGMSIAKGKYIWFVDSDDWVEENCLKDVIDVIENDDLDALWISWDRYDENNMVLSNLKDEIRQHSDSVVDGIKFLNEIFGYCVFACAFIFKRDFLIRNHFQFKENLYFEDVYSIPELISKAGAIKHYSPRIYHYLWRSTSISNSIDEKKIYDLILGIKHNYTLFKRIPNISYFKYYSFALVVTCIRMIPKKYNNILSKKVLNELSLIGISHLSYGKDLKRNIFVFLYNISPRLCFKLSSYFPRK